MKDYKSLISEKRRSVPTPNDVMDEKGNAYFGTFLSEFPNMNFTKINRPTSLPNSANRRRLSMWEAVEVNFEDVTILTAVCDMALFGTALTIIYDKKTKKVTYWQENMSAKNAVISPNLLDGAVTESKGKKVKLKIVNDFGNGKAQVSGCAENKKNGKISYELSLERVSLPSIVSIPFGKNRPLYSQKDLFKATGYIEYNGVRYEADQWATAIIDDHRGYYPYKSHYDWVTTMGKNIVDGKEQYFGINLTRNQSINQDDYNENLIWFNGKTSLLTPVTFKHLEYNLWEVKDEHGMVDLKFHIADRFKMVVHAGIIDINYHITFGELSGYVLDEDGNKYTLDGMIGIGEDKSVKF